VTAVDYLREIIGQLVIEVATLKEERDGLRDKLQRAALAQQPAQQVGADHQGGRP